jgi:hypothetical protein
LEFGSEGSVAAEAGAGATVALVLVLVFDQERYELIISLGGVNIQASSTVQFSPCH